MKKLDIFGRKNANTKSITSGLKQVRVLDGMPMLIACIVIVAALYVLGAAGVLNSNTQRYLLKIFLYCTLGSMWNLMSGYTGMTSLGQQTFIGLAGYSLTVMTATYAMSYWVGFLAGTVISAIVSLILAIILFRMRGMYFAVATWVIAEALRTFFTSWKFVRQGAGMTVAARPYPSTTTIYLIALTLCIIALVVIYFLLKSKVGLGLTAMRDDADAASSVGVDIFKSKLLVFVICAIFTALAGGVFYLNKGSIYPAGGFGISWTVSIVFIVIIGGIGTMAGPVLGSIIYVILEEQLAKLPGGWTNIVLGLIAILVILFLPDGIVGTLQKKFNFEILSQKRFSKE
ncbi:MAG TPA: branched-chain amino acid ABC transporter permease [Clostridiales bacterium]|jgi:branched-chain amino acid transport system permease protein|nr:branched-chain amino acid ABC transporter permease [Clostridiales bacterium]